LNWKIDLIKRKKKKNEGQTEKKIKQHKFELKDEIERKKNSTKVLRTKLEILKNKDWNENKKIWEIAIEGLNWKKILL
jgi:hypothetical protein